MTISSNGSADLTIAEFAFITLITEDEDYIDVVFGGYSDLDDLDLIKSVTFTYSVSVPLPT